MTEPTPTQPTTEPTMSGPTTEPMVAEPVEETWIFGGSRVGGTSRRVHAWLAGPSGAELWFAARGSYVPGSQYRVRVTRSDSGTVTLHGTPVYLTRHGDDTLRARLEAAHRAAETRLRLAALQRNDKRHSALDAALDPLCELVRSASAADRDALIAYVLRRLCRTW